MEAYYKFDKPLATNYSEGENDAWYKSSLENYNYFKTLKNTIVVNQGTYYEAVLVPESSYGYFQITSLSRDDFKARGYDASCLTDEQMGRIASKMADVYVENYYWDSIDFWGDELNLPKIEEKEEEN